MPVSWQLHLNQFDGRIFKKGGGVMYLTLFENDQPVVHSLT
jgi:hypothetical protein